MNIKYKVYSDIEECKFHSDKNLNFFLKISKLITC